MVGRRRVLAVLGAAAAAVLLGGCHVQGTADVISTEEVSLDLLVTDFTFECENPPDTDGAFTFEPGPDVDGQPSCHLAGKVPMANLGFTEFHGVEAGEYWTFSGLIRDDRSAWPEGSVAVRFPGDVVRASQGTIRGNTLWIEPGHLVSSRLEVVALNRPGPPAWVPAAALGAAGGVALVLAVAGAVRRFRGRRPSTGEVVVPADSAAGGTPAVRQSDDPPDAAEPPRRDAEAPEPDVRPVEVDHAWFATPPEAPPTPEQPPEAAEPPDHSMWAPPEER